MATKKAQTPTDEKFEGQDFNLFEALEALDKKDYKYYSRLTTEQQRKFVPYMMTHWMSAIKGNSGLTGYYVMSTAEYANKYLFNEYVQKHPELQWLMLCAASPGLGKQFHQWIPNISPSVSKLKTTAKVKDIREYYKKIYPKASASDIEEVATTFVDNHKKKCHLAELFPNLKIEDIEVLSNVITDTEIELYEKELGN
jgi:hypothetical protein